MRITLDCRSVHPQMGGIGKAAEELARAVARRPRGHQLTVLLGSQAPADLGIEGADVVRVDAAMIDERFEQLQLPVVLKELQTDLYLNPTFSIPAVRTCKLQMAVIHDVVFEDHPEWVEPWLRKYLQRWSRFSATEADHIITVSDHALSRIKKVYGIGSSRISRIYNGVSSECFLLPSDGALERVKLKFGLDRPYLLYLGSLEPKKGVPELLVAFARLVTSGFGGVLVLAGGKGGSTFDLEGLIAASGCAAQVRCLGYIEEDDKRPLLAGCELFVYPSLYEGFGFPPLEAMALGRPCLVSDQTCLPEITGGAARTVDIRVPDSFARALLQGLHDGAFREHARLRGPERARTFSWDDTADQVLDLCQRMKAA